MTAPQITLPPAGPALTLRQAATKALAEMAAYPYWSRGWHSGVTNALGDATAGLVALIDPHAALALADWLDAIGCAAVKHAAGGYGNEEAEVTDGHPMTVALAILGEVA
ncbi:MAG: hypothetical protein JWO75_5161 [Actinomycetia bacterium]|nr:hypothetical protein [Actinomycetes bacterium]